MMRVLFSLLVTANLWATPLVPNAFEKVPANENQFIKGINASVASQIEKHRDAHAKAHGCVENVKVTVNEDLPEDLHVGFFSPGKTYEAMIRFSNGSGQPNVDDRKGGGHGFALKMFLSENDQKALVPLKGELYFEDEKYYKTFDILTISPGREFFVETVADYPAFFQAKGASEKAAGEALAAGKTPEEAGLAAQKVLKDLYFLPEGGKTRLREAKLLGTLASARQKNLLQETYGSFVPSLLGEGAVKYELAPCEEQGEYEIPAHIDAEGDKHFLSKVLSHELQQQTHCYSLRVQKHVEGMPSVEDAVASWSTELSPYVEVAKVVIPRKEEAHALADSELCETISFHPGHASVEHFPIGGIQRARVGTQEEEGLYTVIPRVRNVHRGLKPRSK